jgi:hypothetical protein
MASFDPVLEGVICYQVLPLESLRLCNIVDIGPDVEPHQIISVCRSYISSWSSKYSAYLRNGQ